MGCVIPISCQDVVGIGSAVSVDVIAMSGKETSATVIGHIGVYNVYFCDNQQCGSQAAQDDDAHLVFLKAIVCTTIIKGVVFDRLTAGKIVHAVLNGHLAVFAIIQASPLDIVLSAVHEPQELILLHLNSIEPAGDKLVEIAVFVFAEHILLIDLEGKIDHIATKICFLKVKAQGDIVLISVFAVGADVRSNRVRINGEVLVSVIALEALNRSWMVQKFMPSSPTDIMSLPAKRPISGWWKTQEPLL